MKIIIAIAFIFAILVPDTFAQSGVDTADTIRMFPIKNYSSQFLNPAGTISRTYTRVASSEDLERLRPLGGDPDVIDIPLEISVLSGCAGVINSRPVEAVKMLETPRQVDIMNYAWLLQEIAVLRFLGNTRAVGVHEGELKIITDRGNVTRQQAVAFYEGPNGIRALVSDAVENEFNKISFYLEGNDYRVVLTRNPQNGQCILSYEGFFNGNRQTKTLTATSLEALPSALSRSSDFNQISRAQILIQSALIPSVVFAERKAQGLADGVALAKEALTNFYLKPSDDTYLAVYGIRLRFGALLDTRDRDKDVFADVARESYDKLLRELSPELLNKIHNERRFYYSDAARIPADPRYNVFSTRQPSGGR